MTGIPERLEVVYYGDTGPVVERAVAAALPGGWRLRVVRDAAEPAGRAALRAADAVVIVNRPVQKEQVALLDSARVVVHQGVGVDHFDVEALRERGIPLVVTPAGTTGPVAEHTVLLMLAACRRLREVTDAVVREHRWPSWDYRDVTVGLEGRRVGLAGFGRIGREVARRVLAFGALVTVYPGPRRSTVEDRPDGVEVVTDLDELCRVSQVLSLHVPLRPETHHLLDRRRIGLLPAGAVVVNTARGQLIDEAALVEALTDGRLAAAGLDVLEAEPPGPGHPLLAMPNVVVTPHLASGTHESLLAKAASIAATIGDAVAGRPLAHRYV